MENIQNFRSNSIRNGIILDTNLLILYLIGNYDPNFITRFRKTSNYTIDDFLILKDIVKESSKIIVTPNILTELSNHTFDGSFSGSGFDEYYKEVIDFLNNAEEKLVEKDVIKDYEKLKYFGFADISILDTSMKLECSLLTDDSALYGLTNSLSISTLNINHLRQYLWDND